MRNYVVALILLSLLSFGCLSTYNPQPHITCSIYHSKDKFTEYEDFSFKIDGMNVTASENKVFDSVSGSCTFSNIERRTCARMYITGRTDGYLTSRSNPNPVLNRSSQSGFNFNSFRVYLGHMDVCSNNSGIQEFTINTSDYNAQNIFFNNIDIQYSPPFTG